MFTKKKDEKSDPSIAQGWVTPIDKIPESKQNKIPESKQNRYRNQNKTDTRIKTKHLPNDVPKSLNATNNQA